MTKGQIIPDSGEASSTIDWPNVTATPTTIAGYGITDAYTKIESDAAYATAAHNHVMSSLLPPVASVDFNGQQATNLRIENRTSDPASPAVGQMWVRTDL